MRRFGALNALALLLVFGVRPALVAALVALSAWALLAHGARATAALLLAATLLFALHKLGLEQHFAPGHDGPLGLLARLSWSYAVLRLVDAARAVRAGARLMDPLALLGFLFPFHMLMAGPIGVYRDHLRADDAPVELPGFALLLERVDLVVSGLFSKLVLAEGLRVFAFGLDGPLRSSGLADSLLLFAYLFFDFAGYSLVALGIGRLLGVPTPVNFDRPWRAASLTDFWQRWHASLGAFVRAHVFVPLQLRLVRAYGVRRAAAVGLVALVVSFGFVGLWHRLDWRFLVWGLGMGAALALEKLARDRLLRRGFAAHPWLPAVGRALGPLYACGAVALSLHPLWELLL